MTTRSGSTWKRWEPHTHSPETALNDQFVRVSWDEYISTLEGLTPPLAGIGVTDYFTTEGYRKVLEYQANGRLPNVLLFPNIEMRLSIGTRDEQAVNIHLLVSPEDHDHLAKINDKLARLSYRFGGEDYSCTPDSLRRLGRAWHAHSKKLAPESVRSSVNDVGALRIGANQFKIDFDGLCRWRDADPWLKANTLLAVPNGGDGAGGLPRGSESTFAATRECLRNTAHIMLTANASDREYWLGRGVDSIKDLQVKYGGVKPCLHGSDAHDIERLTNPGERLCWIKAEATWRGFLQVLVEPDDRLFIGPLPPIPPRANWIKTIEVAGNQWCPSGPIDLSTGLVTIIGSRGSGKTALADLLAYGAGSYKAGPASFLSNARKFARNTKVTITWGDDDTTTTTIDPSDLVEPSSYEDDEDSSSSLIDGRALYLSQHFVELLCNPNGRRDQLREEVERVVFERLAADERLGAATFSELLERETEALHDAKGTLENEVKQRSKQIALEVANERRLPDMRKRLASLDTELKTMDESLKRVAPGKAQQKQKDLDKIQKDVAKREDELKALALRIKAMQDLEIELNQLAEDVRRRSESILTRLKTAYPTITVAQEKAFGIHFGGDYASELKKFLKELKDEAAKLRGPTAAPFPPNSYMDLKTKLAAAQKALKDAGVVEKQLADLMKAQATKTQERKALNEQIETLSKARERIRVHQQERQSSYKGILDSLTSEEEILQRLYKPLETELGQLDASERKLTLVVRRRADIQTWLRRGEKLFDLRKRHIVTDRSKLQELAEKHLLPAWEGTADAVAAMNDFQKQLGETSKIQQCFAADVTLEHYASWLYSTEHIEVSYNICYDEVDIETLSPGTRGVVLLIIYLCLDQNDERPIIVDQPEENLDPKSIFADLVRFFKEARKRRQIIMVTHNANLVINTDADQVLIANASRTPEGGPPLLTYDVGVLEDKLSQDQICAILEGGAEAFRQRERRYMVAMRGELN